MCWNLCWYYKGITTGLIGLNYSGVIQAAGGDSYQQDSLLKRCSFMLRYTPRPKFQNRTLLVRFEYGTETSNQLCCAGYNRNGVGRIAFRRCISAVCCGLLRIMDGKHPNGFNKTLKMICQHYSAQDYETQDPNSSN